MSLEEKYNTKSPAVKRLMREAQELYEATEEYHASPLDDNLFEWHFTVKGPSATEFEGGVYHGRIILPPEYPMKPPNIIMLTPNGRFEIHKKICLSISGHHPESWQPSWSIRTALLALIAFMPTPGNETIGSLDYSPEERQKLAKKSHNWECETCGKIIDLLAKTETSKGPKKPQFKNINLMTGKTIGSGSSAPTVATTTLTATTEALKPTVNNITESLRQRLVDRQRLETLMQRSSTVNQLNIPSFNDFIWSVIIIILLFGIILLALRRIFFV